MNKKIVIVVANPNTTSFTYALAKAYETAAIAKGHKVSFFSVWDMQFNPILEKGYEVIQPLEKDLLAFQSAVRAADHVVFVYANWWSTMPAKLKGLFDRCWLPGFAFKFIDGTMHPLLKNKTGRIINICGDQHPFLLRLRIGDYTNELKNGILKDCGMGPVKVSCIGPTKKATDAQKKKWFKEIELLGTRGA
ncbi:MAG: NAD(P)H-dependent oxidoreductase [Alphaproteobacteria bacterium]|nr:NAD(P)H-dependent oxidoreductase [Alphaproteobacteria bacterium]